VEWHKATSSTKNINKRDFLQCLGVSLENSEALCFTWAVMSNHDHLLLRVGQKPLGKIMGLSCLQRVDDGLDANG